MSDPREHSPGPPSGVSIPFRSGRRTREGSEGRPPRGPLWPPAAPWARAGAFFAGIALLAVGFTWAATHVAGWLASRDAYQCAFREIRLEPPPPDGLAIDSATLLEQVRTRAELPERISILNADLGALGDAFKIHGPWFEKIGRVEVENPNIIRVRVDAYRTPVARIARKGKPDLIIDRHAVFLPAEELTESARKRLIRITPENAGDSDLTIPLPVDPRPGSAWVRAGATPNTRTEIAEKRIRDAAALAAFLLEHRERDRAAAKAENRAETWADLLNINPTAPEGLYILIFERTWALWGEAIGAEPAGNPDPEQKWERMRIWGRSRQGQLLPEGEKTITIDLRTNAVTPPKDPPAH